MRGNPPGGPGPQLRKQPRFALGDGEIDRGRVRALQAESQGTEQEDHARDRQEDGQGDQITSPSTLLLEACMETTAGPPVFLSDGGMALTSMPPRPSTEHVFSNLMCIDQRVGIMAHKPPFWTGSIGLGVGKARRLPLRGLRKETKDASPPAQSPMGSAISD